MELEVYVSDTACVSFSIRKQEVLGGIKEKTEIKEQRVGVDEMG